MGEFDKCIICIGLVGYLGFILGNLNEYLRDLRPYFSNYACVWLVWVLIADLSESSQVIGERMKLRAMWIKETCKGGLK